MSKINLMRSVIVTVIFGFILSMSSCQKNDEDKIIGEWKHEKTELRDYFCTDSVHSLVLKEELANYVANSRLIDNFVISEYGKIGRASYTLQEGKLTLKDANGTFVGEYYVSFSGRKTMYWLSEGYQEGATALSYYGMGVKKYTVLRTFKKQ